MRSIDLATYGHRKIGLVIAMGSLNLFLFCAATVMAIPVWIICMASAAGAVIGIVAKSSGGDATIRAMAGSAIAIFSVFGLMLSIFGRLIGP
ncbi:MAG: hypothetical protein JWP89_5221 [Schlesneria sp.]|nr:hypothetical protein [Schlesneria sp.]